MRGPRAGKDVYKWPADVGRHMLRVRTALLGELGSEEESRDSPALCTLRLSERRSTAGSISLNAQGDPGDSRGPAGPAVRKLTLLWALGELQGVGGRVLALTPTLSPHSPLPTCPQATERAGAGIYHAGKRVSSPRFPESRAEPTRPALACACARGAEPGHRVLLPQESRPRRPPLPATPPGLLAPR